MNKTKYLLFNILTVIALPFIVAITIGVSHIGTIIGIIVIGITFILSGLKSFGQAADEPDYYIESDGSLVKGSFWFFFIIAILFFAFGEKFLSNIGNLANSLPWDKIEGFIIAIIYCFVAIFGMKMTRVVQVNSKGSGMFYANYFANLAIIAAGVLTVVNLFVDIRTIINVDYVLYFGCLAKLISSIIIAHNFL